jgi:DNA-binding response OmpR family regulator
MKILLVEDDAPLASILAEALTEEDYDVYVQGDGKSALTLLEQEPFDLLLLDVMLPHLDGIRLCEILRARNYQLPILMVTGSSDVQDQVRGLDAGADDYVVKPIHLPVLFARIRALLRRNQTAQSDLIWGKIVIHNDRAIATYDARPLPLTPKEYALLEMLVQAGGGLVKREDIIKRVWHKEQHPKDDTIRSHIKCLRQKLKASHAPEDLVETVHGRGLRLNGSYA